MQVVGVRAGFDGSRGVLLLHAGQAAASAVGPPLNQGQGAGAGALGQERARPELSP